MPVVDTTREFTNNEQITSVKLNEIMDNSSFVPGAVVTSGGLEVTTGGQMQVASGGITTTKIANLNVITEKIADGAVTPAKLSPFGPAWSNGLSNFNIQQNSLELATGITSNAASYIDFHSSFPIIDNDARIIRESGVNGTLTISNIGTGSIIFSASGGVRFASAPMPNPVGTAPIFGVRAWVNFEGRTTNGNCTIRSSGNVTSVARTAAGKYTVTFATAMQDANYVVNANSGVSPGSPRFACADRSTATVNTVKIETDNLSGSPTDFNENNVMVIR